MGSLLIFLPSAVVHLARRSSACLFRKMPSWLVARNAITVGAVCVNVVAAMLGRAFAVSL